MSEFYQLLGVARDAPEAEIKKAYRKLAMEYHPDRNREPGAEARFKEITEAYEVLRDAEKRAQYDRYGKAGVGQGRGFDYHHVDLSEALGIFMRDFGGLGGFEAFFGGGGRSRPEARRGQDVRITVRITIDEVAKGVKRSAKLKTLLRCATCEGGGARPGSQPTPCNTCGGSGEVRRAARSMFGQFVTVSACPTCGGEGTVILQSCETCKGEGRVRGERTVSVDVPPGVSSNNYLTMRGMGAAGPRGGPPGDLLIMLEVEEDERFERQGDNLAYDLAISYSQAALGTGFTVPTPHGEERVVVPPGTQNGTVIRIKGKGLPRLGQGGTGDFHIRIHVWTPQDLTDEQRRLFQELSKVEGMPPKPAAGFWTRLKEALGA